METPTRRLWDCFGCDNWLCFALVGSLATNQTTVIQSEVNYPIDKC